MGFKGKDLDMVDPPCLCSLTGLVYRPQWILPENFIEMQRLKGEFSLKLIQKLFRFIPKTGESADLGISTYRHSISNFWSLIF